MGHQEGWKEEVPHACSLQKGRQEVDSHKEEVLEAPRGPSPPPLLPPSLLPPSLPPSPSRYFPLALGQTHQEDWEEEVPEAPKEPSPSPSPPSQDVLLALGQRLQEG